MHEKYIMQQKNVFPFHWLTMISEVLTLLFSGQKQ